MRVFRERPEPCPSSTRTRCETGSRPLDRLQAPGPHDKLKRNVIQLGRGHDPLVSDLAASRITAV
jgi:hypothetical protein